MSTLVSLETALTKLARLQGIALDPLKLKACLQEAEQGAGAGALLAAVCVGLGLSMPVLLGGPDRARLPLLARHAELGWCVIEDQHADGRWRLHVDGRGVDCDSHELADLIAQVDCQGVAQARGGFEQELRGALRQYRGVLAEAALATLFIGALTLAISMFSMQVYDRVIPTRSDATLVILSIGVVMAIAVELVMKLARSHIMDAVVVGMDGRLSRDIFQRLLNVRIDQLPGSVGSLAAQVRGYEQVRSFFTGATLFALVDAPLSILFIVVIALMVSPVVAAAPLVFGVIAVLCGFATRRRIDRRALDGAQSGNCKTGLLVEAVEGAETIKSGAGGWKILARWIKVNASGIHNEMRMRQTSEHLGYAGVVLQQLSYATLVVLGAWQVMRGEMTMGGVIAASILGGRVMAPLLAIPGLMVQHAHARAAMHSLELLYGLKQDHEGIAQPLLPSRLHGNFRLDDVRFDYPACPLGVAVAKLEIRAGERIGIVGPIGAGKSTLLRLLAGLYVPQHGRVILDGLDLAHISRQVISTQIGYLQQEHRLFHGTLRENLLIGMNDPGDEALLRASERSGLGRLVARHPKGFDLPIMEGGKGLSGGQRQLLAFTRLLLAAPPILLLDEPTASMDEEQEMRCLSVLAQELETPRTLVLVTHKASSLALVNRVIVVADNRIVADGPRDAVCTYLKQRHAVAAGAPSTIAG